MPPELVKFQCPHCQKVYQVPQNAVAIGKKLRCPCQQIFVLEKKHIKTDVPKKEEIMEQKPVPDFANSPQEKQKEKTPQEQEFENALADFLSAPEKKEENKALGRYQIKKLLGKGGMGKVYQAYDPQLDKDVALKTLLAGNAADEIHQKRFIREAEATAKLDHPNIIKIYDIGFIEKQYYFSMEMVDGWSFDASLKQEPRDRKYLLEIIISILHTMGYVHNLGIIHRDLKPANIMLTKDHVVKIMDFGLVKLVEESNKLTNTGTILGTLSYMAPEQAKAQLKEIDYRCDLYAIGIILYEALVGHVPFAAKTAIGHIRKIVFGKAVPPCEIDSSISQELSDICLKSIAKEKEQRYQNAGEFIAALQKNS